MNAMPEPYISLDDYFALEETGEGKHEYYRGEIFAMTGASLRHNLIVANVIANLHPQLRGKSCRVYPCDLRVKVEATGLYTYPDVLVVCGPVQFDGTRQDTVTNPTVLIEVLSPGTEGYDRGKKFQHYRSIASLREYLMIAQDAMHVEHFARCDAHEWRLTEFSSPTEQVRLDAIQCVLALGDIYENAQFDE